MERQIPENVYLTRGLNVYTHIHKNINHKDTNHLYKDLTKVIVSTTGQRKGREGGKFAAVYSRQNCFHN